MPEGIDGGNLRPLLENAGKGKVKRAQEELIFHFPFYYGPQSAIRQGNYKLLIDWDSSEVFLFDLANDIEERDNLAKKEPAKTSELRGKLMDYLKKVDAERFEDIKEEARRHGKIV
ncbi:MAG: hypothetical protein ACYTAO_11790 [Planctomycetota bacterium]